MRLMQPGKIMIEPSLVRMIWIQPSRNKLALMMIGSSFAIISHHHQYIVIHRSNWESWYATIRWQTSCKSKVNQLQLLEKLLKNYCVAFWNSFANITFSIAASFCVALYSSFELKFSPCKHHILGLNIKVYHPRCVYEGQGSKQARREKLRNFLWKILFSNISFCQYSEVRSCFLVYKLFEYAMQRKWWLTLHFVSVNL